MSASICKVLHSFRLLRCTIPTTSLWILCCLSLHVSQTFFSSWCWNLNFNTATTELWSDIRSRICLFGFYIVSELLWEENEVNLIACRAGRWLASYNPRSGSWKHVFATNMLCSIQNWISLSTLSFFSPSAKLSSANHCIPITEYYFDVSHFTKL